jgi:hypothetical protein
MCFNLTCAKAHAALIGKNAGYLEDWNSIYRDRAEAISGAWGELDGALSEFGDELPSLGAKATRKLQGYFARVAEKRIQLSAIRTDMSLIAKNEGLLVDKFNAGYALLNNALKTFHRQDVILYGNIKDQARIATGDTPKMPGVDILNVDYRDVVRYRIVSHQAIGVAITAINIWEEFFEMIIMCKNHYFNPVSGGVFRPYRGIHFVLVDESKFPFELQLVTRHREAVGVLDHGMYKGIGGQIDEEVASYIREISVACNVLESSRL